MKTKKISISIFRVSKDSKFLDMIFDCPEEYYFTSLLLEVRGFDSEAKKFISHFFDISNALFVSEGESITDKKHWTVRLPLDKLGICYPAIYKATFKITPLDENEDCGCEENCLEDYAVCSDINKAYHCMLSELTELEEDSCFEISDDLIRKYLLLYGHQSALTFGDYETAERYFKLITNCFDTCSNEHGCICGNYHPKLNNNSCNCHNI